MGPSQNDSIPETSGGGTRKPNCLREHAQGTCPSPLFFFFSSIKGKNTWMITYLLGYFTIGEAAATHVVQEAGTAIKAGFTRLWGMLYFPKVPLEVLLVPICHCLAAFWYLPRREAPGTSRLSKCLKGLPGTHLVINGTSQALEKTPVLTKRHCKRRDEYISHKNKNKAVYYPSFQSV